MLTGGQKLQGSSKTSMSTEGTEIMDRIGMTILGVMTKLKCLLSKEGSGEQGELITMSVLNLVSLKHFNLGNLFLRGTYPSSIQSLDNWGGG